MQFLSALLELAVAEGAIDPQGLTEGEVDPELMARFLDSDWALSSLDRVGGGGQTSTM